jgi:hypothetical protein
VEEEREGRGTSWGSDGEGSEERDAERSVSTLSFRVTKEFGLRYFDFDGGPLDRDLGSLVEEEVFSLPSEKTNEDNLWGYCNMSKQGDDSDKGREKEGEDWAEITTGDLRTVVYLFRRRDLLSLIVMACDWQIICLQEDVEEQGRWEKKKRISQSAVSY